MENFQEFASDVALFVETGMVGIKQGDEDSAKKIFDAVGVLSPDPNLKKMGYGLIAIHKMDVNGAKKWFSEIYQADPNNYRARVFLAFTHLLSLTKNPQDKNAANYLKELNTHAQAVAKNAPDVSTREFANTILDWERDLDNAGKQS